MHCGFCMYRLLMMYFLHSEILFLCWLLSRRPNLIMLCILILCPSLFSLRHDASPPVDSRDIFNSSTSRLVTSVEFSGAPS